MPGRRRRRRSKNKNLIKNLKFYSSIFVGCLAIAGGLSLATGKIPGMFNSIVSRAISTQIEAQVGNLGGIEGGAAKDILNKALSSGNQGDASRAGGGGLPGGVDINKLKKDNLKELAKKYSR